MSPETIFIGGVITHVGVLEEIGVLEKMGTIKYVGDSVADVGIAMLTTLLLCYIGAIAVAVAPLAAGLLLVVPGW